MVLALSVAGLMVASDAAAQAFGDLRIEASNLLELQVGRDFSSEEDDRVRFFDQFLLDVYPTADVRLGLRFERFQDSTPPALFGAPTPEYEYDRLAQRFVEWNTSRARLRVGHGYAILGHGLLFRAFELPGVVRQSTFPIVSYAESRELDGVILESWTDRLELTLLHGTPVIAPDRPPSPDGETRRGGSVTGGRAMLRVIDGLRVGGSTLWTDALEVGAESSDRETLGAAEFQLDLNALLPALRTAPVQVSTSVEYASRAWQPWIDGLRTETGFPHALYSNTQIAWSSGALGIETKDYHQFLLPVNDPPTLVPEFSHRLLNRTTHLLLPQDERGTQITLGQSLPGWLGGGALEAILARSKGRSEILGEYLEERRYAQHFVAVDSDPRRDQRLRLYFSDGEDEFENLTGIRTVGVLVSSTLPRGFAVELDVGHQVREFDLFGTTVRSDDFALVTSVSRASLGQVGVLYERTNDPVFEDDPLTEEIETDPRDYLGGTVAWRASADHDVIAFYGQRRGGIACTSGTCYFVPDFEGLELRVLSRF